MNIAITSSKFPFLGFVNEQASFKALVAKVSKSLSFTPNTPSPSGIPIVCDNDFPPQLLEVAWHYILHEVSCRIHLIGEP